MASMFRSGSSRRKLEAPGKVRFQFKSKSSKVSNDNDDDLEAEDGGDDDDELPIAFGNGVPDNLPEGTIVVQPEGVEDTPAKKKRDVPVRIDTAVLESVSCTACGRQLNPYKSGALQKHYELKVAICKHCEQFLSSGEISKDDDGADEQCRWCGQGGRLLVCDDCSSAFCKSCVMRNFGRSEFNNINNQDSWQCYLCNKAPIQSLRENYKKIRGTLKAIQEKEKAKVSGTPTTSGSTPQSGRLSTPQSGRLSSSRPSAKATSSNSTPAVVSAPSKLTDSTISPLPTLEDLNVKSDNVDATIVKLSTATNTFREVLQALRSQSQIQTVTIQKRQQHARALNKSLETYLKSLKTILIECRRTDEGELTSTKKTSPDKLNTKESTLSPSVSKTSSSSRHSSNPNTTLRVVITDVNCKDSRKPGHPQQSSPGSPANEVEQEMEDLPNCGNKEKKKTVQCNVNGDLTKEKDSASSKSKSLKEVGKDSEMSKSNSETAKSNYKTEKGTSQPTKAETAKSNSKTEKGTSQPTKAETAKSNSKTEKGTSQSTKAETAKSNSETAKSTSLPTKDKSTASVNTTDISNDIDNISKDKTSETVNNTNGEVVNSKDNFEDESSESSEEPSSRKKTNDSEVNISKKVSKKNKTALQTEDVPKEKECIPKEKENLSKVKEDVPKEKEDVPKEKENLSKVKEDVPKEKEDVPKEKEDVPKEKEDVPKEKEDVPKEKEDVSKENDVLEEKDDVSKEIEDVPNETEDVPKETEDISKETEDVPKVVTKSSKKKASSESHSDKLAIDDNQTEDETNLLKSQSEVGSSEKEQGETSSNKGMYDEENLAAKFDLIKELADEMLKDGRCTDDENEENDEDDLPLTFEEALKDQTDTAATKVNPKRRKSQVSLSENTDTEVSEKKSKASDAKVSRKKVSDENKKQGKTDKKPEQKSVDAGAVTDVSSSDLLMSDAEDVDLTTRRQKRKSRDKRKPAEKNLKEAKAEKSAMKHKKKSKGDGKPSSKSSSSEEEEIDKEIAKLSKLPTMRKRKAADMSDNEETTEEQESAVSTVAEKAPKRSKPGPKCSKKGAVYDDLSSDDNEKKAEDDDVDEEEDELPVTFFGNDMDTSVQKDLVVDENEMAKNGLLEDMESDNDDNEDEEDNTSSEEESDADKKPMKKKPKQPKVKKEDGTESENGDDSDENIGKRKKIRNKLLDAKLSDSDSDIGKKKKKKEDEESFKADKSSGSSSGGSDLSEDDDDDSDDSDDSDDDSDTKSKKKGKKKKLKKKRGKGKKKSDDDDDKDSEDGEKKSKKGKGKKRRRIKKMSNSSDEGGSQDDEDDDDPNNSKAGKRRQIRKVMSNKKLEDSTRAAAKAEEKRRKRISAKQREFNIETMTDDNNPLNSLMTTKLVLEAGKEEDDDPVVEVNKKLVRKLKPHQVEAIQFLWDCLYESVKRSKKQEGAGCILAHCMGLGKTLSVVAFVHTVLTHEKILKHRTCLVVTPLNTVLNWKNEWSMWLEEKDQLPLSLYHERANEGGPGSSRRLCDAWPHLRVSHYYGIPHLVSQAAMKTAHFQGELGEVKSWELACCKQNAARAGALKEWQESGGVMIMGYEMYRNLTIGNRCKNKRQKKIFQEALVDPGPDLVICDEGHILKNEASAISKAMNQMRTKRRVVLTGTPLQNNLTEYHCMLSFVKPNLLGTRREFTNRFISPIQNGQCTDSTQRDVKLMKARAHVLHEMLAGCVQRRDYSALTKFLPPKQEYVISVRLTNIQIELYDKYLELTGQGVDGVFNNKGARMFTDYQNLMKIWTHPWVLKLAEIRDEMKAKYDDEDEDSFIDDEDSDEEESMSSSSSSSDDNKSSGGSGGETSKAKPSGPTRGTRRTRAKARKQAGEGSDSDSVITEWKSKASSSKDGEVEEPDKSVTKDWWAPYVTEDDRAKLELSNKLYLLFEILRMCEEIGDKVLIFSQSILSLNIIESLLEVIDSKFQQESDNMTEEEKEQQGEGVFGRSWTKNLDYYRMDGSTSAQNRQIWASNFNDLENYRARLFLISTRAGGLGINLVAANRVIIFDASWNPSHDVQSIFRVYRFGQTKPCYIYRFLAQGTMEEKIYERQVMKLSLSQRVVDEHQIERHFSANDLKELYNFRPDRWDDGVDKPTLALPKDPLLAEIFTANRHCVVSFHEHDSLLENQIEQTLTEEEKKAAWEEYENEKKGIRGAGMDRAATWPMMAAAQILSREQITATFQALKQQLPDVPEEQFQLHFQQALKRQVQIKQEEIRRMDLLRLQEMNYLNMMKQQQGGQSHVQAMQNMSPWMQMQHLRAMQQNPMVMGGQHMGGHPTTSTVRAPRQKAVNNPISNKPEDAIDLDDN